jgi:hypothetical protein
LPEARSEAVRMKRFDWKWFAVGYVISDITWNLVEWITHAN